MVVGLERDQLCGGGAPPFIPLRRDPARCAAELYTWLHMADDDVLCERIIVELPPDTPDWAGIRDRLIRAAGAANSL